MRAQFRQVRASWSDVSTRQHASLAGHRPQATEEIRWARRAGGGGGQPISLGRSLMCFSYAHMLPLPLCQSNTMRLSSVCVSLLRLGFLFFFPAGPGVAPINWCEKQTADAEALICTLVQNDGSRARRRRRVAAAKRGQQTACGTRRHLSGATKASIRETCIRQQRIERETHPAFGRPSACIINDAAERFRLGSA